MNYVIPELPLTIELETKAVLKLAAKAHQALAELKGVVTSIPNQSILINTLSLQEAKDSVYATTPWVDYSTVYGQLGNIY